LNNEDNDSNDNGQLSPYYINGRDMASPANGTAVYTAAEGLLFCDPIKKVPFSTFIILKLKSLIAILRFPLFIVLNVLFTKHILSIIYYSVIPK